MARAALLLLSSPVVAGRVELLRVPASACVCAPTRAELAAALVAEGPSAACGLAEMTADVLHCWSDAEMEELQWPALAATARAMRSSLAGQDERHVWARDVVSAHALDFDGSVWLLPAAARLPRNAPTGATLQRCEQTGELLLVHTTAPSVSAAGRRRPRGGSVGAAGGDSAAVAAGGESGGGASGGGGGGGGEGGKGEGGKGEGGKGEGGSGEGGSRAVTGAISSGWRSNAELLLTEGRAQAVLESERVYLGADLLQVCARG
jgi:hypothetical protein